MQKSPEKPILVVDPAFIAGEDPGSTPWDRVNSAIDEPHRYDDRKPLKVEVDEPLKVEVDEPLHVDLTPGPESPMQELGRTVQFAKQAYEEGDHEALELSSRFIRSDVTRVVLDEVHEGKLPTQKINYEVDFRHWMVDQVIKGNDRVYDMSDASLRDKYAEVLARDISASMDYAKQLWISGDKDAAREIYRDDIKPRLGIYEQATYSNKAGETNNLPIANLFHSKDKEINGRVARSFISGSYGDHWLDVDDVTVRRMTRAAQDSRHQDPKLRAVSRPGQTGAVKAQVRRSSQELPHGNRRLDRFSNKVKELLGFEVQTIPAPIKNNSKAAMRQRARSAQLWVGDKLADLDAREKIGNFNRRVGVLAVNAVSDIQRKTNEFFNSREKQRKAYIAIGAGLLAVSAAHIAINELKIMDMPDILGPALDGDGYSPGFELPDVTTLDGDGIDLWPFNNGGEAANETNVDGFLTDAQAAKLDTNGGANYDNMVRWVQDMTAKVQAENPSMTTAEVNSEVERLWDAEWFWHDLREANIQPR